MNTSTSTLDRVRRPTTRAWAIVVLVLVVALALVSVVALVLV